MADIVYRETKTQQLAEETMETLVSLAVMHMHKEPNHIPNQEWDSLITCSLLQVPTLVTPTHMPLGVVTKIMLPCGMLHLRNSSNSSNRNKRSSYHKGNQQVTRIPRTMHLPDYRHGDIRVIAQFVMVTVTLKMFYW